MPARGPGLRPPCSMTGARRRRLEPAALPAGRSRAGRAARAGLAARTGRAARGGRCAATRAAPSGRRTRRGGHRRANCSAHSRIPPTYMAAAQGHDRGERAARATYAGAGSPPRSAADRQLPRPTGGQRLTPARRLGAEAPETCTSTERLRLRHHDVPLVGGCLAPRQRVHRARESVDRAGFLDLVMAPQPHRHQHHSPHHHEAQRG